MAKRSKEENGSMEEERLSLAGTQQSKVDEDNMENKSQNRPSRNSRKVIKYTDFDDEDDELDDFESDFDEDMDLINKEDEEESDEDEELDLEDEEFERVKKVKKSVTKKKSESNISKTGKPKKSSKENIMEDDFESEEEGKGSKATKKKKLSAPKNLTKRNVANLSNGSASVDAGEAIFNYMKEQNRPYSVQNVVDNLHNVYSKKQVTDEMDRLATEGKFVCKEYGKQKVYLIDQSDCKELNKEEMEALDKSILSCELELNDLEARLKQLKQETRNISIPLPINVLEEKIEQEKLKVSFIC